MRCRRLRGAMSNGDVRVSGIHYHIRWLPSRELDWERHHTPEQAEEAAVRLSRENEKWKIEQFGEDCPQCPPD